MLGNDNKLNLQGVYNTLYNATTRPDFKFAVTRYFIDEWVPLLGPSLAWLIVGLRQHCFWNRRSDWCIIDKATLSRETALDERTIERCLKKPFSGWFVIEIKHRYRYRTQVGKKVRDKNRYQLLLDEPLSPRHQLGLANLLRQVRPSSPDSLEASLNALQTILALPDLTDKISYTGQIPKSLPRRTILELVEDNLGINLADYATDERVVVLDQYCSHLHNLIVQPNKLYVGWQYFRLEWVRLLGHALAWIIIYLRRHCFWDESSGELRDTMTIFKKDLAASIGQTTRNLANLMDNPYASLFFTHLAPAGSDGGHGARNKPTSYQVRLVDEPLTPDDQQRIAIELRQRLQGEFYGHDLESGQLNLFPIFDRLSSRQKFAYGQASEEMPDSDEKKRRLDDELPEKMPQHGTPAIGKNDATLKDSLILSQSQEIQKQQIHAHAAELKRVERLLQELSIQEPTRSKLLTNPDLSVAKIGAWFLYAETQPSLFDPRRYVIKRLLANDSPPPEFLAFAQLDDRTWHLFEEAADLLRIDQAPAVEIPAALLDTFLSWVDVYVGGLEPAETRVLLTQSQAAETGDDLGPPTSRQPALPTDPERERAVQLWQTTLKQLRLQMTKQTFESWLKQTEVLNYQNGEFEIVAQNEFAKDWLENRLTRLIETTLTNIVGSPTTVRFVLSSPVVDETRPGA